MKNIPGLLLFILPAPLEPEFANAAPDFWSIASNIVCLDCAQLDTGHKADDLSGFENLSRIEVASLAGFDFDYDVIQNQINKAKHEMEKTPDNPWIARSLVNWLTRQGDYYIKNGYLNQAVNVYEKALNITTDFSDRFEKDSEWLRKRYKSLEKLGEASFQLGDIEKALSAFNESVSIRRSLIQTDPERTEEWQNELAAGLLKLGDFYLDADMEFDSKLERAFDAFNESLVLRTALAEENRLFLPYQYDLAVSHSRVAIIYQEMGNIEKSIRHLTQALSILEYLTKENSNALNWQRAYNFCRKQLMLLRAKRDKL